MAVMLVDSTSHRPGWCSLVRTISGTRTFVNLSNRWRFLSWLFCNAGIQWTFLYISAPRTWLNMYPTIRENLHKIEPLVQLLLHFVFSLMRWRFRLVISAQGHSPGCRRFEFSIFSTGRSFGNLLQFGQHFFHGLHISLRFRLTFWIKRSRI